MRTRFARMAAAFVAAVLLLACCTDGDIPRPEASRTVSGLPSPPVGKTWRRLADAPTARQEVAASVVGNKIYVVGGLVASGRATDAVEIYEPASNTWAPGPSLPIAVHHAMAATLNGDLVVMGGFRGDLSGAATDRVFILRGGRWREGPRLRRPRAAAAAVSVHDPDLLRERIVVVGGISSGGHIGPVEIFDGIIWRDGAPIPSLRDHLGAAADRRIVYAMGGRRAGTHFGTNEAYDVVTNGWRKLRAMPTPRSGLGVAAIGSLVFAVGGEGPRIFPEVEMFLPFDQVWERKPDLGVPRHGVGVVAIGSTIYALVGGDEVGLGPSAACEAIMLS